MADAGAVKQLRDNIGDVGTPPAWDDAELAQLLDAAGGVEPRARLAALLPLWAEAAGRTAYSTGTVSESAQQAFAQLGTLFEQAKAEVAALDAAERDAAQATAQAAQTAAVPVQWVF